jgi:hypothetical protein
MRVNRPGHGSIGWGQSCESAILDQTKASLKETRFSLDDICRGADYTVIGRKWYYAPSPDQ